MQRASRSTGGSWEAVRDDAARGTHCAWSSSWRWPQPPPCQALRHAHHEGPSGQPRTRSGREACCRSGQTLGSLEEGFWSSVAIREANTTMLWTQRIRRVRQPAAGRSRASAAYPADSSRISWGHHSGPRKRVREDLMTLAKQILELAAPREGAQPLRTPHSSEGYRHGCRCQASAT